MSNKWSECEPKREMNENNKPFESNNQIRSDDKTLDDRSQPLITTTDLTTSPSNGRDPCKVCNNEDPSAQFFASGPFYAIEAMAHNKDTSGASSDNRERSDKCNVLYAEMPHIFNDDIDLGHQQTINQVTDNSKLNEDRHQLPTALDHHFGENYQLFCYNCCSPLSLNEDCHLNHKLYYISTNDSNPELKNGDVCDDVEKQSSSLSSPIMLKFCRESGRTLCDNSEPCETSGSLCGPKTAYTTVIKPKAVRPRIAVNFDEMSSLSLHSALPALSFHGSANVLTDRDESAFTQIPRRRSNSEATHHYQSIVDNNNGMPSSSHGYSRPLQRYNHQRSKSVNKTFVDSNKSLGFVKFGSMNDKHFTKRDSNSIGVGLNRNGKRFDINSSKLTSSQMQSSEPIHMSLEEVKRVFTKNQTKLLKNGFLNAKTKRNLTETEDKNIFNKSKSKSKLKSAFEHFFRHKRRSDSDRQSEEYDFRQCRESFVSIQCSQESASPFTHRALPPLPNNPSCGNLDDNLKSDETNEMIETNDDTNSNEILSKEEEDRRQKFLDYAASIERVKDVSIQ